MCRWLAYSGSPIYLETLLTQPSRSLVVQSRFARENFVEGMAEFPDGAFPTNGDGFGIGWYGEREFPGLYRDYRPAWSDRNLVNLAAQIRSGLFLAHLRAAYTGIVQRTNSHPFRHGCWLFQHNGEVSDFELMRRELQLEIEPELYNCVQGTTDTETCFYLALSLGLADNPKLGLERMAGRVEEARRRYEIEEPFRLTCAATDGDALYAVRYSSDGKSKTLYHNKGSSGLRDLDTAGAIPDDGIVVLSEPLDECTAYWQMVPEASFMVVKQGEIQISAFEPAT